MSKPGPARTVTVPWRRIGAALPAIALIGGGVAMAATGQDRANASNSTKASALVHVPPTIMEYPASPALPPARVAEGLGIAKGTKSSSNQAVVVDRQGVPERALEAYRHAEQILRTADPSCHIDWPVLAAIGKVESDHGRFGGSQLNGQGISTPGIFGIPLDGTHGTAKVSDTDSGLYDQDGIWDRAVGPMQFIPSTWRAIGADADADGFKNPQSIEDSATTAAAYLCAGRVDLRQSSDLYGSLLRYNNSDSYVRTVEALAEAYRDGVNELPASFLPAAFNDQPQGPPKTGHKAPAKPKLPPRTTKSAAPKGSASSSSAPSAPGSSSTTTPPSSPSPSPSTTSGGGGGVFPPIFGASASSTATPTAAVPTTVVPTTVSDLPLSAPASAACASLLDGSLCNPV